MFTYRTKIVADILIVSALLISGIATLTYGQMADGPKCDQCGMSLDAMGVARYTIIDNTGASHIACCPICALKQQRSLGDINITSFCDYYGPSYPITIISRNNGTDVTVNPLDALVILGNGCTKNRLVYNSSAADALLAQPNNGTSKWLSPLTNATVLENATRMGVAQVALINGAGLPSPTPSPTPSPFPTPNPTASPTSSPTQQLQPTPSPTPTKIPDSTPTPSSTTLTAQTCEVCGMDVSPDSQTRYRITDGNGNIHYVECFMCALQLVNDYQTLHIETYCDWYGPNYTIVINTTNYGQAVTASPSTTMYLRGGSCVTARAAYNQTAADNLLANGFSQYTSTEQRYALPSTTQVKLVNDAINTWYAQADATAGSTSLTLILGLIVGAAIIGGTVIAYKKIKR